MSQDKLPEDCVQLDDMLLPEDLKDIRGDMYRLVHKVRDRVRRRFPDLTGTWTGIMTARILHKLFEEHR